MKPEQILEIARRFTVPETESRILFDKDGNATGGTVTMTYWNFCEEELIAFARSVIEAERERIKRIMEQVGVQGNHDKWFDCADMIMERIGE